jgi:hypothetical protein
MLNSAEDFNNSFKYKSSTDVIGQEREDINESGIRKVVIRRDTSKQ